MCRRYHVFSIVYPARIFIFILELRRGMLAAVARDTPDRTPWWPKGTIWRLPGSLQIQPAGNALSLNAMKVDVISHASTARTLFARFNICL